LREVFCRDIHGKAFRDKERELNKLPVFESRVACLTRREKVGILEYSCLFAT
jgi:hypothetical protein